MLEQWLFAPVMTEVTVLKPETCFEGTEVEVHSVSAVKKLETSKEIRFYLSRVAHRSVVARNQANDPVVAG